MYTRRELSEKGFAHMLLLPLIVVLVVAAVGTYVVVKSKAYSYVSGITPYSCNQDPTPTLRSGSTGNCVKSLQYLLNRWMTCSKIPMTQLTVDGQFGSKTDAAVREYQRRNGLKVDGIVGNNTWAKLTSNYNNGCGK